MILEIVAVKCPECGQMVTTGGSHPCWHPVDADGLDQLGQHLWNEVEALERLDMFLAGDREASEFDDAFHAMLEDKGIDQVECPCGNPECEELQTLGLLDDDREGEEHE